MEDPLPSDIDALSVRELARVHRAVIRRLVTSYGDVLPVSQLTEFVTSASAKLIAAGVREGLADAVEAMARVRARRQLRAAGRSERVIAEPPPAVVTSQGETGATIDLVGPSAECPGCHGRIPLADFIRWPEGILIGFCRHCPYALILERGNVRSRGRDDFGER